MRKKKGDQKLISRVRVEYKDNPILLENLRKFILLALEISDKTAKESEEIQKKFLLD
ncbi:hypothetical protein KAR91_45145 [Candidatus Pacearchaeota archaeon]|nr:hypothetical protein [Candidatus Pacearchaeota archaeon]